MFSSSFDISSHPRMVLAILFLLVGCSQHNSQLFIVGGIKSPESSPAWSSTVAIGKVPRLQNDIDWYCSGTLVSRELIVTAAHCLYDVKGPSELRVLFGDRIDSPNAVISKVMSFQSFREEGYRYFPNFDVAWIKLDGLAPISMNPVKLLPDWEGLESFTGQPRSIKLAGFGQKATTCPTGSTDCNGVKREVDTILRRAVDNSHFVSQMIIGPTPGFGSCFGDSGGPAFVNLDNEWYLAGVLSGKSPLMNTREVLKLDTICESGESVYNFIGPYADWIMSTSVGESESFPEFFDEWPSISVNNHNNDLHTMINDRDYRKASWDTIEIMIQKFKDKVPNDNDGSFFLDAKKVAEEIQAWEEFSYNGIYLNPSSQKLRSYQIVDLSPLKHLRSIKSLSLIGNKITDTAPLIDLVQLESLTLGNNVDHDSKQRIPWDLGFLVGLKHLKKLNLANNKLGFDQHAIPWNSLTSLESLDLSGNLGIDLSLIPWADLQNLREINISRCGLKEISALTSAQNLIKLNLSQNQLLQVEDISNLKHLEELDVTKNPISDFSFTGKMQSLKILKRDENK